MLPFIICTSLITIFYNNINRFTRKIFKTQKVYIFSNLAKLAISFFVPFSSKAISNKVSLPIGFTEITDMIGLALESVPFKEIRGLGDVLDADGAAREFVKKQAKL